MGRYEKKFQELQYKHWNLFWKRAGMYPNDETHVMHHSDHWISTSLQLRPYII